MTNVRLTALSSLVLLSGVLAGCASSGSFPSLAKRAAESDSTTAAPVPVADKPANPALPAQLTAILAKAEAGQSAFNAAADTAEGIVAKATGGGVRSEAWIAAQMALSQVERMRAPVHSAMADADIAYRDALISESSADARSVEALRQQLQALDDAQAGRLESLAARLRTP